MNLLSLTAVELGKKIKAHEVSVEEATRAALDAIAAKEDAVHSFVTVDEEGAIIVRNEQGIIQSFNFGEISIR